MTLESGRNDIVPIQMLRGIAALMVVWVHLDVQLRRLNYPSFEAGWLTTGVDIFFVISGFIMWTSVSKRKNMTGKEFIRNRIIRVVPLYWAISFFVLVTVLLFPHLFHTTVFEGKHALASFFFIPARHPFTHTFWPLLVPGWTLNLEMLFYAMFAVAITAGKGSAPARLAITAGLITGALLIANAFAASIDILNFYANPMMLEFISGMLIGVVYLEGRIPRRWPWFGCVVLGFGLLWCGRLLGSATPVTNLIAATLIVAGALFSPRFTFPGLRTLGDVSYSLYLTHIIALAAVSNLWGEGLQWLGPLPFMVVALTVCVFGAVACFHFVERPMAEFLKGRSLIRSKSVAAT